MRRTSALIGTALAVIAMAAPALAQSRGGVLSSGIVQLVAGVALLLAVLWYGFVIGFRVDTKHRNQFGVDEYASGAEYARHNFARMGFNLLFGIFAVLAIGLILWGAMRLSGAV